MSESGQCGNEIRYVTGMGESLAHARCWLARSHAGPHNCDTWSWSRWGLPGPAFSSVPPYLDTP